MFGERRPPHQERPTVSPPCFGNRTGKHRAFVAERGCSHATGGLRPPLLVVLRYGHLPTKLRLVRYTNARLQERRASVHRGSVTTPAMAIGFRGVITFTTHDRTVPHGLLTRIAPGAALGGRTRIVANVRRRFARTIRFTTTAGLRQPLLVHDAGLRKNNDIRGAQTHVLQERRRRPPVGR
jgi:hypothetical protein